MKRELPFVSFREGILYAAMVPKITSTHAISFALAILTLFLFWPVTSFEFINHDDPEYILSNPAIQKGITGPAIAWAFSTVHASNWHPVTWLSHAMDCRLFG